MIARRVAGIFVFVSIGLAVGRAARSEERPAATPKPDKAADIQKLIKQLGDDSFQAREEATHQLRALGEKALDAVDAARHSDDPEVRRRAESIAVDLQHIRDERLYRAIRAKIKDLPVDQFIDHLATRKEFDKPENWDRLHELAQVMATRAGQVAERKWALPSVDYKNFPTNMGQPRAGCTRQKICVDGIKQHVTSIRDCVLVSGDSVQGFTGLIHSIVFINGDLKRCTRIDNCFVFCNGNLGRVTSICNSIILTTDDFVGSTGADNTFFQVKSVGRHTVARQNVYLNLNAVRCTRSEDNKFIQNEKGPLQVVQFFDPARLGLEFSGEGERVRIDKVHDGKPFARAGLRAGDLVTATDQGAVPSAEELRKVLRRRLPGEPITLKVRRGDKIVECKVKLAD